MPTAVRTHRAAAFAKELEGKRIERVTRRGKTLLVDLSGGWTLTFHFKLWGLIQYVPSGSLDGAQIAAVIRFRDGGALLFRELQLSELGLHKTKDLGKVEYLAGLGIEPLSPQFTPAAFRTLLSGRANVRAILTDQERIAGIGNLWAHEILHAARLRPDRRADSLSPVEAGRLYRAIRSVLRRAIRAGGEPEFIDAAGRRGRWKLAVYERGGQRCPRGDGTVKETRLGGRPSFYCPKCQK